MGIFIKDLYSDRKGKEKTQVISEFKESVLNRMFSLMKAYSTVRWFSYPENRERDITRSFLNRLYYHLCDETNEEKNIRGGFRNYEEFVKKTILSKFFDSLELYCYDLFLGVCEANNDRGSLSGNELENFIKNMNELLIRNGLCYRLSKSANGRIFVIKISESKFVQDKTKEIVILTSNKKFKGCQDRFVEAENCFAKKDYEGVLSKCNALIEELLCIILNKGSGHINDLFPEFLKKFDIPRTLNKSISRLVETIQHTRSTYGKDIHGKNKAKNKEDVSNILEEICEFILGETAIVGIFIIKIYKKRRFS